MRSSRQSICKHRQQCNLSWWHFALRPGKRCLWPLAAPQLQWTSSLRWQPWRQAYLPSFYCGRDEVSCFSVHNTQHWWTSSYSHWSSDRRAVGVENTINDGCKAQNTLQATLSPSDQAQDSHRNRRAQTPSRSSCRHPRLPCAPYTHFDTWITLEQTTDVQSPLRNVSPLHSEKLWALFCSHKFTATWSLTSITAESLLLNLSIHSACWKGTVKSKCC